MPDSGEAPSTPPAVDSAAGSADAGPAVGGTGFAPEGPQGRARPQADTLGLVEAALQNLVNQFARPLECLRELVQNAIDAGSPRVRVFVDHEEAEEGQGLFTITVEDSGEGMDERLIDTRLTRMFASSKEHDLTKIGRFGIGFTSVFAIEPELVHLQTGRLGESWELLFHPDRSFDKVSLGRPFRGTRVRLFKRLAREDANRWARECREVLAFWCAHSETDVLFVDRVLGPGPALPATEGTDPTPGAGAHGGDAPLVDPLAAFAAADSAVPTEGGVLLSAPLSLDADVVVERREGPVHALVGIGPSPRFGWFNGGLTLLSTRSTGCLGDAAPRLGHLSLKVKSNRLEHTLTRDNVIQDAHWREVLGVLLRAAADLSEEILAQHQAVVAEGGAVDRSLGQLARELVAGGISAGRLRRAVQLPVGAGQTQPLRALEAQRARLGLWLLASGDPALDAAVRAAGWALLDPGLGLRAFLAAWEGGDDRLQGADNIWCRPQAVSSAQLAPADALLLRDVERWLRRVGLDLRPVLGDFGGPRALRRSGRMAWLGAADGELVRIGGMSERGFWQRFRASLGARSRLWIDRHHPLWRGWCDLHPSSPVLASFAVAQLVLHETDLAGAGRGTALEHAVAQVLEGPA